MFETYLGLIIAAMMPAIFTIIIYLLDTKTKFKNLKQIYKDIIIGIVFGGLAVLGTEFGVSTNGAVMNCRDGAVITAGFLFSARAGIIAGLIGGIERWFCVYWGGGTFTRIACTVATIAAGFISAFVRKFMLKDKKPSWTLATIMAIVIETFHMLMVFFTNFSTPDRAIAVVKACTIIMIPLNGAGVLVASLAHTMLSKEKVFIRREIKKISRLMQSILLITVIFAYLASSGFVLYFQSKLAKDQVRLELSQETQDTSKDLEAVIVSKMSEDAQDVLNSLQTKKAKSLVGLYNLLEITFVSRANVGGVYTWSITDSSIEEYIGQNFMDYYPNASSFSPLFEGEEGYDESLTYLDLDYNFQAKKKYFAMSFAKGIIIIAYNDIQYVNCVSNVADGLVSNRHIGKSGLVLIMDSSYRVIGTRIISYDSDKEDFDPQGKTINLSHISKDTVDRMTLNGDSYFAYFDECEGFYVLSMIGYDEALEVQDISIYVFAFLLIIIFAFIFIQIYMLVDKIVGEGLEKINSSLAKITSGNLNEVVDVKDTIEFKELSDDINATVDTLKRYIADASKRIEEELELAKNIQRSALPLVSQPFLNRKDFKIFASMDAAKEVGGDFYDFYFTNEDTLNILIADVSGKGIPAAMFMMKAKALLKGLTEKGLPIEEVFTNANKELCESNEAGMFITAWQAQINLQTKDVVFVNAGHNPPLLKSQSNKYEYLKGKSGFVLAGFDGFQYKPQSFKLQEGDALFLYTDGVTEATNVNEALLGEERLLEVINSKEYLSPEEICSRVKQEVIDFTGEAPQFDDVTMLSFMYNGGPGHKKMTIEEAHLEDIESFTAFVEESLEAIDAPMKEVIKINIALDEILSNIIKYGYNDVPGPISLLLEQSKDLQGVFIKFVDKGKPYNPITAEEPDTTLSAEDRKIGGLGIYMVKKSMDDMRYKYENGENILTIYKTLFTETENKLKIK